MHEYLVAQLLFAEDPRHKLTAHVLNIKRYFVIDQLIKLIYQSNKCRFSIGFNEPMLLRQIPIWFAGPPKSGSTFCFHLQEMCKADAYSTTDGVLGSGSRVQGLDPDASPWLVTVDSTMLAWRKFAQ